MKVGRRKYNLFGKLGELTISKMGLQALPSYVTFRESGVPFGHLLGILRGTFEGTLWEPMGTFGEPAGLLENPGGLWGESRRLLRNPDPHIDCRLFSLVVILVCLQNFSRICVVMVKYLQQLFMCALCTNSGI